MVLWKLNGRRDRLGWVARRLCCLAMLTRCCDIEPAFRLDIPFCWSVCAVRENVVELFRESSTCAINTYVASME